MVFWCLRFPPKNERKQVDLRYHSSKVEFLRSFFGGNRRHQTPFRNYLTFRSRFKFQLKRQLADKELQRRQKIRKSGRTIKSIIGLAAIGGQGGICPTDLTKL